MIRLIIYEGTIPSELCETENTTYSYGIRAADPNSVFGVSLNNPKRLNEIAEKVRDEYCSWISTYLRKKTEYGVDLFGFPLLSFSDLSCKRTELFDTFNVVCNSLLISEQLEKLHIDEVCFCNLSPATVLAMSSKIRHPWRVHQLRRVSKKGNLQSFASDLRYCLFLLVARVARLGKKNRLDEIARIDRAFFRIHPKLSDEDLKDKKYGEFLSDKDWSVMCVLTDHFHQRLSFKEYVSTINRARRLSRAILVDDHLRVSDLFAGIRVRWLLRRRRSRPSSERDWFRGVDLTQSLAIELRLSIQRLWRLTIVGSALKRVFHSSSPKVFVYYLFEYPLGRVISAVMRQTNPSTKLVGFQHGPASWRKLVCFLDGDKQRASGCGINLPLPDCVLVESVGAQDIYRWAGYENVDLMDRVFRLGYLDKIKVLWQPNVRLIATGLNDGEMMLRSIKSLILAKPGTTFLLKPHPLSDITYLNSYMSLKNLKVVEEPIESILGKVSKVYVSYSSIGLEALKIGAKVEAIHVPGVVSQSPLHDRSLERHLAFEY